MQKKVQEDNNAIPNGDHLEETIGSGPADADTSRESTQTRREQRLETSSTRDPHEPVSDSTTPEIRRSTLLAPQLPDADAAQPRYTITDLLGQGANARVFTMHDSVLAREIAVKVANRSSSREATGAFVNEARVAASLEHPNIMPVYDIDMEEGRELYFTMKKIHGTSLGDLIRNAVHGKGTSPILENTDELIRIFLKVCDATAYAHNRGIIHHDIKPANIMLGEFGEVLLVDWGTAHGLKHPDKEDRTRRGPTGSPAYMSPEQARCEPTSAGDDIYAIGASLFHTLIRRHPVRAETTELFWEKKRRGDVDPPSNNERASIPAPVLAIVMKALAPDPVNRYRSVQDLAADLKNYQSGLAVSAHRDTLAAFIRRWYHRNRQTILAACAFAAVIAISGGFFYRMKLKEMAFWGTPVCSETLTDDSWKDRWIPVDDAFARNAGRLVTDTATGPSFLMYYQRRLYGSMALEFDGEMLPGHPGGDLSVSWCDSLRPDSSGTRFTTPINRYYIQAGANDNSMCGIYHNGNPLAYSSRTLKAGTRYRIRAEVDEYRMSLFINGHEECRYDSRTPFTSGYLGMYGFYSGKTFSNVKIFVKSVPEKVSILAIGDREVRDGRHEQAIRSYNEVAQSHAGSELGREALYRQGVAYMHTGMADSAYALWGRLRGTSLDNRVSVQFLNRLLRTGAMDSLQSEMTRLYLQKDPAIQMQVCKAWSTFSRAVRDTGSIRDLARLMALQQEVFPNVPILRNAAASALIALRRYDDVISTYPDQVWPVCHALNNLGRTQEILARFPQHRWVCALAWMQLGRPQMVLDSYPDIPRVYNDALFSMGRIDEAIANCKTDQTQKAQFLLLLNRPQEILDKCPEALLWQKASARLALGQPQYVVDNFPEVAANGLSVRNEIARALVELGRTDEMLARFPNLEWIRDRWLAAAGREDTLRFIYRDIVPPLDMRWYFALRDYERTGSLDSSWGNLSGKTPDHTLDADVFAMILLPPFLRALKDPSLVPAKEYADVLRDQKYANRQRLWHDAAYLAGLITDKQYMDRPVKAGASRDLLLLKGMRAEWRRKPADTFYRQYLESGSKQTVVSILMLDELARWRIRENQQ